MRPEPIRIGWSSLSARVRLWGVHTKWALVFENYCRERGYLSERIESEVKAGRFPDYQIVTPAGPVIVEIKELTANDADRSLSKH
jgi:hypothetical protein